MDGAFNHLGIKSGTDVTIDRLPEPSPRVRMSSSRQFLNKTKLQLDKNIFEV